MNSEASPQVSRTGAEAILAADLVTGAESILAVRILSGRGYIARRNGVRERVELSVHVRAFVHVNTTRTRVHRKFAFECFACATRL
jgi:hypothetical protein